MSTKSVVTSSGSSVLLGPPTSAPQRTCSSVGGSLWLLVRDPCASPWCGWEAAVAVPPTSLPTLGVVLPKPTM